jgi:hypothetical protein
MNDAVQVVNRRRRERSGYATTAALDRRQLSRHHRQADADRIPDPFHADEEVLPSSWRATQIEATREH